MNPAEFCRDLETYLCRKNDGHLIRIVGPVFEQVCEWAARGVPIKIAYRGIDRYFERREHSARRPAGARRRPVRIEFCEADILDAFDEWRRAVGISASGNGLSAGGSGADTSATLDSAGAPDAGVTLDAVGGSAGMSATVGTQARVVDTSAAAPASGGAEAAEGEGAAARRRAPLLTHIDRAMARLTQCRVDRTMEAALGEAIERVLGELDTMRASARGARGEGRHALLDRLAALDRTLIAAARASLASPSSTSTTATTATTATTPTAPAGSVGSVGSTALMGSMSPTAPMTPMASTTPTTPAAPAMTLGELRAEAARELEPFRTRLSPDAFRAATETALDRLLRERWRLPSLSLDE